MADLYVTPGADPLPNALGLAEQLHATQVDKLGAPYILHVQRVVDRVGALAPADLRDSCRIAAALHDVVEDCGVSTGDLSDLGFAAEVVRAVAPS